MGNIDTLAFVPLGFLSFWIILMVTIIVKSMIENPFEEYPWEKSYRDEYEAEVREVIEKEMYDYDSTYLDWLNDFEYLPANQSLMDTSVLHQFCDILNEIEQIRDGYYNFREEKVTNEIIKTHS